MLFEYVRPQIIDYVSYSELSGSEEGTTEALRDKIRTFAFGSLSDFNFWFLV